jgi:hypothetical protein
MLDYLFLASAKRVMGNKGSERNTVEEAISVYSGSGFSKLDTLCFCGKIDSRKKAQMNGRNL